MKTLILNGHPDPESYCNALAEASRKAALARGHEVRLLRIPELDFDPNLHFGYRQRTELEPDLLSAWTDLQWCEHLILIHPIWWSGLPAKTKGFFDRLFLPGFAFQYREKGPLWDKLLQGRTAHLIQTGDSPGWYWKWVLRQPGTRQVKKGILDFVGFKVIRTDYLGPIRGSSDAKRERWLEKISKG